MWAILIMKRMITIGSKRVIAQRGDYMERVGYILSWVDEEHYGYYHGGRIKGDLMFAELPENARLYIDKELALSIKEILEKECGGELKLIKSKMTFEFLSEN